MPDILYTDGGVIGRNPSKVGGTWAYRLVSANGVILEEASGILHARGMPRGVVTNNQTEFYAVVKGLESLPAGWCGTIASDSLVTLHRFFDGWKMTNIPPWLVERASKAMRCLNWGECAYLLLAGHPSAAELASGYSTKGTPVSEHNVWCDEACAKEAAALASTKGGKA